MRAERTDSSTGRGAGLPENQPLGSSHCTAAVTAMAGSKDKQAEPTKRPRLAPTDQAMASAPRPRRAIQPLTMTELTRGFLAHEDELQTIWAAGSCALGSSPGLASSPSSRTGTPFRLHLFCCGGCPLPLPPELKTPWRDNESPMGRLHGSYPCAHVQRGPSCRLRSRDSAVLGRSHGQEGCSSFRTAPEAPQHPATPHADLCQAHRGLRRRIAGQTPTR